MTFFIGYIITYAVSILNGQSDVTDAGWVYYNAHFVGIETRAISDSGWAPAFSNQEFNLLVQYIENSAAPSGQLVSPSEFFAGPLLPPILYFVVPIVVLLSAGFLLVRATDAETVLDSVMIAGTIPVGTTLAAGAGTMVFTYQSELLVQPAMLDGVLMAGLFYPTLFCPVGGVVATLLASRGSLREFGLLCWNTQFSEDGGPDASDTV
jgi:hypothetical protein